MVNIKARKRENGRISNNVIQIEGIVTSDNEAEIENSLWSFVCTDAHSEDIYHSKTALENEYLNYQTKTPIFELIFPSHTETYNIKLLLKSVVMEEKEIDIVSLNANNELVTTKEVTSVPKTTIHESPTLTINMDQNSWG